MLSAQDDFYRQAAEEFGAALGRLARAYETDADKRRDLLQEIHLALWRSFEGFAERCSLRTWVYRVAHNTALSWVTREKRVRPPALVSPEEPGAMPVAPDADRHAALETLMRLVQRLEPLDRQVILAYLEGMDAAAIGELTGLSARNVATKIHRIKAVLARSFNKAAPEGGLDAR